jgi:D-threo-aldose 1-dehydrogenase
VQERTTATPPLPGFGTAHLMGRIGTRESTRLVHAALDSGITHFDTARVYGLGDAEQMLGDALRGRPDVSVYTKVGQGHPYHSRLRARVHAAARPVARARARLLRLRFETPGPALRFECHTDFSLSYVRASVETSLRMLRRDTLDGLLLHEITTVDTSPELVGLLEALVCQGKVRRFGVASESRALAELAAAGLPGDVVQQAGGPFVDPIEVDSAGQLILHSVFGIKGKDLSRFRSWVAENPEQRDALLGVVAAESLKDIAALLISFTSTRWASGRILFASTSENRIRDNATAAKHRLSVDSLNVVSAVLDAYKARIGRPQIAS